MNTDFVIGSASIVLIDLVLAGDNAVVIGMAARTLAPVQRRTAILIGTLLAVAIRIVATFLVAHLLAVPFLSALGGVLVCWIAVRLVVEDETADPGQDVHGFWRAIRVIAVADLVMSADNILAVGGASNGRFELILFGLALSIPLVVVCSSWIARLLDRYPRLSELGAAVLGWTGGQMILHDLIRDGTQRSGLLSGEALAGWREPIQWGARIGLALGVVAAARLWIRVRQRRADGHLAQPRRSAESSAVAAGIEYPP